MYKQFKNNFILYFYENDFGPYRFLACGKGRTEVAETIALKQQAKVVLLHVVQVPASGSFNVEGEVLTTDNWEERIFSMNVIESAKQKLERLTAELTQRGVNTSHLLRLGSPFNGIREIITSETVDLVVIGTAGHSKLEEMIIGSNMEKVVRHAKCPVLTVHHAPLKTNFKSIVYATNLKREDEAFATVVLNTREKYNGTIHLVRINTPSNFEPDVKVKKEMEAFAKKVNLTKYTINTLNHYNEEDGIIHFTKNINADLIALSTHGRTGLAHVLAGSIAEDLANHSVIPVLTYVMKKSQIGERINHKLVPSRSGQGDGSL